MRLFLDSNIVTYIAFFESFLTSGRKTEFAEDVNYWSQMQNSKPENDLIREICALHVLYRIDDTAHFDWLCSDLGIKEIGRIRNLRKRSFHDGLLGRLVEHRADVDAECRLRRAQKTLNEKHLVYFPLFLDAWKTMQDSLLKPALSRLIFLLRTISISLRLQKNIAIYVCHQNQVRFRLFLANLKLNLAENGCVISCVN